MVERTGSAKRGIISPDLLEERAKCAFNQLEMSHFLQGGKAEYERVAKIYDKLGADPETRNTFEFNDMTMHEQQEDGWRRLKRLYDTPNDTNFKNGSSNQQELNAYFQGFLPLSIHITMFRTTFENLASEEQKAHWLPKINNLEMFGAYAQTELGHGSNIRGIETTATLDMTTDEIVINTPTITATKYWPGDIGTFTSHAAVFANLIVGKNNYGFQAFLVPLRDIETWKHLPGVKTGQLGPKIGY